MEQLFIRILSEGHWKDAQQKAIAAGYKWANHGAILRPYKLPHADSVAKTLLLDPKNKVLTWSPAEWPKEITVEDLKL